MKRVLNAVLFTILTIITLIGLFYLTPYIEVFLPIDVFWIEVLVTPLLAVGFMIIIKFSLFKESKPHILAIGFGAALIILAGIGYYYRKVPDDFYYIFAFIMMTVIAIASFIISLFAIAFLRNETKEKEV